MTAATLPALAGTRTVPELTKPVFIADLHLSPAKPKTVRAFLQFMRETAPHYRELFVLGDLFEFWLGDDAAWIAYPVTRAFQKYAASGGRLYFMQGNRDVLLGEDYARLCGGELLKPQIVVQQTGGPRILLSHGDEWCLLDTDYQAFRKMVRDPAWQAEALNMPVLKRLLWALKARKRSKTEKKAKSLAVMDVVTDAVAVSARSTDCCCVIHGHTHRPSVHLEEPVPRWVIPDWSLDGEKAHRFGWIALDKAGIPVLTVKSDH